MSSVKEGWYVDPSTGTNLRFWNGSTWTGEVAPLPDVGPAGESENASPGTAVTAGTDEPADPMPKQTAGTDQAENVIEPDAGAKARTRRELRARRGPEEAAGTRDDRAECVLEPDVEATLLTRRELRARRGPETVDDAPKHLPPMAPSTPTVEQPVETGIENEVDIPARHAAEEPERQAAHLAPADEAEEPTGSRRVRIFRLSALLGLLAVVSGAVVLTAGRI